jgi:hypothetical protein
MFVRSCSDYVMHRDGLQGGPDLGDAREAVASAAEECEASCLHAIGSEGRSDGVLRSIAAVASITAERARLGEPRELTSAVSLCARMIEAAAGELVGLSELPAGLEAAAAARRCAKVCQRTLVAFYDAS